MSSEEFISLFINILACIAPILIVTNVIAIKMYLLNKRRCERIRLELQNCKQGLEIFTIPPPPPFKDMPMAQMDFSWMPLKDSHCQCCKLSTIRFFPDVQLPCFSYYNRIGLPKVDSRGRVGCRGVRKCPYLHNNDESSLINLFDILRSAKKTIDLCIYVFSFKRLSDLLKQLHHRNVAIRIITDANQKEEERTNDRIPDLVKSGIEVKVHSAENKKDRALMHNKFVIVDQKTLVLGSFNWTTNAVAHNNESYMVSTKKEILTDACNKFNDLWRAFSYWEACKHLASNIDERTH